MQRAVFSSQDEARRHSGGAPVTASPEYRGMYSVGRTPQPSQPSAAMPNMSMYASGAARPAQQSQGTAYAPQESSVNALPSPPRGGVVGSRPYMSPVARPAGLPPRPPAAQPPAPAAEEPRLPRGGVVGSRPSMSPVVRPVGMTPRPAAPVQPTPSQPTAPAQNPFGGVRNRPLSWNVPEPAAVGDGDQPPEEQPPPRQRTPWWDTLTPGQKQYELDRISGRLPPQPPRRPTAYAPTPLAAYSNRAFTSGWNDAMAPYANTPGMRMTPAQTFGGEGLGNLAYADNRPEPFVSRVNGFGAQTSPQEFFPQRDAFIQRLNDERGRLASQAGVYYPGERPQLYRPSRDFGALWRQAGDMVQGGWSNPLAGLFG